jgi:hypothetical protein
MRVLVLVVEEAEDSVACEGCSQTEESPMMRGGFYRPLDLSFRGFNFILREFSERLATGKGVCEDP